MKENLKTVNNYAKVIGKSTTWVYYLIKEGKVKARNIDGVWFVVVG